MMVFCRASIFVENKNVVRRFWFIRFYWGVVDKHTERGEGIEINKILNVPRRKKVPERNWNEPIVAQATGIDCRKKSLRLFELVKVFSWLRERRHVKWIRNNSRNMIRRDTLYQALSLGPFFFVFVCNWINSGA